MHFEVHVAINYVMSQLYEKLPRRRVNIFGEELEKALKEKFDGHWYPEAPEKGSGYRCLKVGRVIDPPDPLLEKAAYDSGLDVQDILEHLPKELNIWIDPGEVSFRVGDKGVTEILYSAELHENSDNEVARTFNPEAKCFQPNEFTNSAPFNALVIAKPSSPVNEPINPVPNGLKCGSPPSALSKISNYKNGKAVTPNSMHCFAPRTHTPTFTTATFAQTKFGSTKLKTNSKRSNRMSPTEFANYIKQRAQMQQQMQIQQHHVQQQNVATVPSASIRAFGNDNFYTPQNNYQQYRNGANGNAVVNGSSGGGSGGVSGIGTGGCSSVLDSNSSNNSSSYGIDCLNRFSTSTFADDGPASLFFNQNNTNNNIGPLSPVAGTSLPTGNKATAQDKNYLENFNFTLNSPGPSSPYQHLLLAN